MKSLKILVLAFCLSFASSSHAEEFTLTDKMKDDIEWIVKHQSPWCYESALKKCEIMFLRHYGESDEMVSYYKIGCMEHLKSTKIDVEDYKSCQTHFQAILQRLVRVIKGTK
jgi:hypothetical protein